jgi:hypothetical protein
MRIRLKNKQTFQIDATSTVTGARLVYHVNELGNNTTLQILAAVKAAAESIPGAAIDTVEVVTLPDADCCDVAVNYRDAARQEDTAFSRRKRRPGEELWGFDVSGGTANVKTALEQVAADGDADLLDNIADYVGWNGKFGEAFQCAGVNIIVPAMRETCRKTMLASGVTAAFRRTLSGLVGKVNSVAFHDWEPGEVLFAGASLSTPYYNDLGQKIVDVTYSFNIQPNEDAPAEVPLPIPTTVNGHDYLWTITQFDPDTGHNAVKVGVVSRVYDYADLTALGVGGSSHTPDPDPEPETED